mmetsp:Transcript_50230/g.74570  ORF Transcript_50230/g.74570 Transcript_50230/m.74570 type:complete len:180 (-) Transcript_50230:142-681(-)
MRKAGLTVQSALELIRSRRPEAAPISSFMKQLSEYETKCRSLGVIREKQQKVEEARVRISGPAIGPSGPPGKGATSSSTGIGPSKGPSIGPKTGPPPKNNGIKSTGSRDVVIGPAMPCIGPQTGPTIAPSQAPEETKKRHWNDVTSNDDIDTESSRTQEEDTPSIISNAKAASKKHRTE